MIASNTCHCRRIKVIYHCICPFHFYDIFIEDGYTFEYLSDKYLRVLKIVPGVYHGYKALEPNTILMYYVTEKYNPKDEIRKKVGDFGEEWGIVNK